MFDFDLVLTLKRRLGHRGLFVQGFEMGVEMTFEVVAFRESFSAGLALMSVNETGQKSFVRWA
jgi:hypothetical protein